MEFLLLVVAHFLALLSPGPDFFLLLHAALRLPRLYGFSIALGIAMANAVYLAFVIFGLEALRDYEALTNILKYFGAVYLVFVGLRLLKAPRLSSITADREIKTLPKGLFFQCIKGFLSGILNPKNIVFYLSLFSLMVSETTTLTNRILYGLWMFGVVLVWDSFLVHLLSRTSIKTQLGQKIFYVEKLSGLVLSGFGLSLAFF